MVGGWASKQIAACQAQLTKTTEQRWLTPVLLMLHLWQHPGRESCGDILILLIIRLCD